MWKKLMLGGMAILMLSGCDKNEVGDVSLGLFPPKTLK
ncbi:hypothetical protein RHSA111115_08740 [Rheinheimera salexigens]